MNKLGQSFLLSDLVEWSSSTKWKHILMERTDFYTPRRFHWLKPICSLLFHPGFSHSLSPPSSSSPPVWGSIPQLSHLFQCFLAMATMEKNAFLFWFCSECHASPCAVNRTLIFCEKCVLVAAWRAQRSHLNNVFVFLLWPLCTLWRRYLLHYMRKQKVSLLPVNQEQ